MTFGEIYSRVCFYVWGNSSVPAAATSALQGENGIIANVCRKIMQDFNYWFMHTWTEQALVSGTQSYVLPSGYKQVINVLMEAEEEGLFRKPLVPLGGTEAQDYSWQTDGTADNPIYYEITDEIITFYPIPSASRNVHIIYWEILSRPTTSGFLTESNDLTSYGADLVIYKTVQEMFESLKEFDSAQVYKVKADEEEFRLRSEQHSRMYNHLMEIKYRGV